MQLQRLMAYNGTCDIDAIAIIPTPTVRAAETCRVGGGGRPGKHFKLALAGYWPVPLSHCPTVRSVRK